MYSAVTVSQKRLVNHTFTHLCQVIFLNRQVWTIYFLNVGIFPSSDAAATKVLFEIELFEQHKEDDIMNIPV